MSYTTAERIYPFAFLRGEYNENAMPPILSRTELQKQKGDSVQQSIEYPTLNAPWAMDMDTHGREFQIKHDYVELTLKSWGASWMTSEKEKQASPLLNEIKMVRHGENYAALQTGLQEICCMLGTAYKTLDPTVDWATTGTASESVTYEANDYCRTQLVAGYRQNIASLRESDVIQFDYFNDMEVALTSGKNLPSSNSHLARPPFALGETWKSIIIMHTYAMESLKKNDPKYFNLLKDADVRGPDNRAFKGLEQAPIGFDRLLKYDGHLILSIKGTIADKMLFTGGVTQLYDESGNLQTAAVDGATCIVLMGAAMMRAVGSNENWLKVEFGENKWDGWFDRMAIHKLLGTKACIFPYTAGQSDYRELGRGLIHVACKHPIQWAND
jgi:hypothetical protein